MLKIKILYVPGIIVMFRRQKEGKVLSVDALLSYIIILCGVTWLVLAVSD